MKTFIKADFGFVKNGNYYCGFELFCVDELPNYDIEDKFLMQEFFNQAKIAGHSMIVRRHHSPAKPHIPPEPLSSVAQSYI